MIGRGRLPLRENALDEKGILNAGDHAQRTAAATTAFDVSSEDAFETLHPAHAHVFGEGMRIGFLVGAASPGGRGDGGAAGRVCSVSTFCLPAAPLPRDR